MTTPESEPVDDSYPRAWKPRERRDRDRELEPPDIEEYIASLSPRELTLMLQRVRRCADAPDHPRSSTAADSPTPPSQPAEPSPNPSQGLLVAAGLLMLQGPHTSR